MRQEPPKIAEWLLERITDKAIRDSALGDFRENYCFITENEGVLRARRWYWLQLVRSIPSFVCDTIYWSAAMFKNYLRITLRTLRRHRGFSLINILGLSVGMSICMLLILFWRDQLTFESFHKKGDRIYRINSQFYNRNHTLIDVATSPASLPNILREQYPEVEKAVEIARLNVTVLHEGSNIEVRGIYAKPDFFDIFSFGLQNGDAETALDKPNTILLSQETAKKLFEDIDPIGKLLTLDNIGDFIVTGIIKKPAGKTHLAVDVIASYSSLPNAHLPQHSLSSWDLSIFRGYTYLLLRNGSSPSDLESQLPGIIERYYGQSERGYEMVSFGLQKLTDINLGPILANAIGTVMPKEVVYALMSLGCIIMLTACFNYMSLSVARSLKRAREIGVRKVFGANRQQILRQFILEAVIISLIGLVVAIGMLTFLLQAFNQLYAVEQLNAQLALSSLANLEVFIWFFLMSVLIGVLAGLYPAFMLSAFLPVKVIKGVSAIRGFSGLLMRKFLIVTQFAVSFFFVVSTIVLYLQSDYFLKADYGFDKNQLISLKLQNVPYQVIKNELSTSATILGTSATNYLPLSGRLDATQIKLAGAEYPIQVPDYSADPDFINIMGLELVAGRNFSNEFATDKREAVILNEAAVREWNLGTPMDALGKTLVSEDSLSFSIIGIIRNYHFDFVSKSIRPMMLRYTPDTYEFAILRVAEPQFTHVISQLESIWKRLDPIHPIQYAIFDKTLGTQILFVFRDLIEIVSFVALIAVIIASLGLLAIVSYSVENRVKEVGVRRVVGATGLSLVFLLSKDFLKLLVAATLIAIPLIWFVNNLWLQQFAQQIELGFGVVGLGILPTFIIGLVSVFSLTLRAAAANPVESLRYE